MNRYLLTIPLALAVVVAVQARGPGTPERAAVVDERSTDADVRALATKYPGLKDLQIGWPGMTDSALVEVGTLATVETIDVRNPSIYYSDGRVKQVVLSAAGWKALRGLPKLRELSVGDVKIDEAAMKEIGQLKQLSILYLAHNGVTDAGAKHLAGMTQLTKLGLLQKHVTDESVPALMKLQKVHTLLVDQTGFTDAAVKQFATLPALTDIDIRAEKVTSDGVKALVGRKTLRRLTVHQRQVPAAVLAALRGGNPDLSVGITDVARYLTPLGGP